MIKAMYTKDHNIQYMKLEECPMCVCERELLHTCVPLIHQLLKIDDDLEITCCE